MLTTFAIVFGAAVLPVFAYVIGRMHGYRLAEREKLAQLIIATERVDAYYREALRLVGQLESKVVTNGVTAAERN